MSPGQRVVISARWSSFRGRRGVVVEVAPYLAVKLDGELFSLRFGADEVIAAKGEAS